LKLLSHIIKVSTIAVLLLQSTILQASHSKGVDLTYKCIGNNQYDFLLTFYQDCAGTLDVTTDVQPKLLISSVKCGYFEEVNLDWLREPAGTDYEVTTLCKAAQSTCKGGPYDGVEKFKFGKKINLPFSCDDWLISYTNCCRNEDITNLVFPENAEIYVEARINNTNGICNNSPTFSGLAVPYMCVGQKSFYNHGVTDVDGNNLQFSLINPMQEGGVPIKIRNQIGFSSEIPIRTINDDFYMNPETGQMQFTPAYPEKDVLTVLVEEFNENNVLIGSVMRDMQIILYDCSNQQSILENNGIDAQSVLNALFINETTIEACPANNIQFQLNVSDADALDTISYQTNLTEVLPNATFTQIGINPITLTFNFTPKQADVGSHNFILTLLDNFCPVPSNQTFGFTINISNGTDLGTDIIKCDNNEIKLNPTGGSNFTWLSMPVDNSISFTNNSKNEAYVNPTQTTTYIVNSNLSGLCKNADTLKIEVTDLLQYEIEQTVTACKGEMVSLRIKPQNANANYTYAWQPAELLLGATSANPTVIALNNEIFYVNITSPNGCTVKDSIIFKVSGTLPEFSLISAETEVCPGTPVAITVENECNFCQPDTSTINSFDVTPFNLIWEDAKLQLLIRAEELTESGLSAGLIEQIALTISRKFSSETYENLQISMGQTGLDELNLNLGFIKGLSTVFPATDYDTVLGENIFTFNFGNTFYWDGLSNLIIEFCYDNNGIDSISDEIVSTATDYTSCLTSFSSQAEQCNITAKDAHQLRPNIRFIKKRLPNELAITWDAMASEINTTENTTSIIATESKFYYVEVSANNCTASDSVYINTLPLPTVQLGKDVTFASGETVQLIATGNFESFEWINPIGLSDVSITNPIYNLPASHNQIIEVQGNNGCTNTDSIKLTFLGCIVEMANAFSPNNDGINDTFGPIYLDVNLAINQYSIYNRYGQKVFEANRNNLFWNGTSKNKKLPIGVYSYFLNFTCNNEMEQQIGNVTLIR